jgi:hypothetical protein
MKYQNNAIDSMLANSKNINFIVSPINGSSKNGFTYGEKNLLKKISMFHREPK